jgi:hypothetical protein
MNESPDTEQLQLVSRREAIRRVGVLLGGVAFVGGQDLLAAVEKANSAAEHAPGKFSAQDIAYLDEIAETILPATKTPGAKAAKTGAFMALMVTDAYSADEQKIFRDGMRKVEAAMQQATQVSFMAATPAQRLAILTVFDQEQKRAMNAREAVNFDEAHKDDKLPAHYFRMMKELAMLGFFTSEIGCNQVLRYVESPGRFDPCVPYAPGEPAWALHA